MVQVDFGEDPQARDLMAESVEALLKSIDQEEIDKYPKIVQIGVTFFYNCLDRLLYLVQNSEDNEFIFMDTDVVLLEYALHQNGEDKAIKLASLLTKLNEDSNSR